MCTCHYSSMLAFYIFTCFPNAILFDFVGAHLSDANPTSTASGVVTSSYVFYVIVLSFLASLLIFQLFKNVAQLINSFCLKSTLLYHYLNVY